MTIEYYRKNSFIAGRRLAYTGHIPGVSRAYQLRPPAARAPVSILIGAGAPGVCRARAGRDSAELARGFIGSFLPELEAGDQLRARAQVGREQLMIPKYANYSRTQMRTHPVSSSTSGAVDSKALSPGPYLSMHPYKN